MPMSDEQSTELMRKYLEDKEKLEALKASRDEAFRQQKAIEHLRMEKNIQDRIGDFETNSSDLNDAAETRQEINKSLEQGELTPRKTMNRARYFEKLQNMWGDETPFQKQQSRKLGYLKDAHIGALQDQGFELAKKGNYEALAEKGRPFLKQHKMINHITGESTGASTPQALLEMLAIEAAAKGLGAPELASQSPQELSVEDPNSPEFKRRRVMIDALGEIKRQNQK